MNRVKEIRISIGMTQKELADSCGLSRSFITHIENGTRTPSIKTANKIAEVLGCTIDYLFGGKSGTSRN